MIFPRKWLPFSPAFLLIYSTRLLAQDELSLNDLLELKVETATKSAQKISEAPAVLSVVTAADIATWGYRSVGEALDMIPGMYNHSDGFSDNFGVRGINGGLRSYSRIMKVMINGQPISFRPDGTVFLGPDLVPIHMVERIEVVRGPASALYGANAFLGVVNIIIKTPEEGSKAEAHLAAGLAKPLKGGSLELVGSSSGKDWTLLAGASGGSFDRSGLELPESSPKIAEFSGNRESRNDMSRPRSALARYSRTFAEAFDLEVLANYSRTDAHGEFLDFGSLSHENRISLENQMARTKIAWRASENFTGTLSLALASGRPSSEEKLSSASATSYPKRDVDYKSTDLMLEARYQLSAKDSITVGYDVTTDDQQLLTTYSVNKGTGAETLFGSKLDRHEFTNKGIYVQYTGAPVEDIGLTLNARKDEHSVYEDSSNYRAGLVKSFAASSYVKVLYGTSFKAPAAAYLYGQPLYVGDVIGNPKLKPESAQTIETQVGFPLSDTAFANISAFKTEVEDKVELIPSGANQLPQNVGEQKSLGSEIEVKALVAQNQINANVSWNKSQDEVKGKRDVPTSLYPALISNLAWVWRGNKRFEPGLKYKRVTERRASRSNILANNNKPYQNGGYSLLGASVSSAFEAFRLNHNLGLRIHNLADSSYEESGFGGINLPGRRREVVLDYSLFF